MFVQRPCRAGSQRFRIYGNLLVVLVEKYMAIPGLPGGFFSSTRETNLVPLKGHPWWIPFSSFFLMAASVHPRGHLPLCGSENAAVRRPGPGEFGVVLCHSAAGGRGGQGPSFRGRGGPISPVVPFTFFWGRVPY